MYKVEVLREELPGSHGLRWDSNYNQDGVAWRIVENGQEVAIYDNVTDACDVRNNMNIMTKPKLVTND